MANQERHYSGNFGKFVTLLVQNLKVLGKKLICSQHFDSQFLLSLNILSLWTHDATNFLKISGIMSLPIFHFKSHCNVVSSLN